MLLPSTIKITYLFNFFDLFCLQWEWKTNQNQEMKRQMAQQHNSISFNQLYQFNQTNQTNQTFLIWLSWWLIGVDERLSCCCGARYLHSISSINSKNQNNFDLLIDEEMNGFARSLRENSNSAKLHWTVLLGRQRPSAKQKPTAIPILKENCWMVCAVAEWPAAVASSIQVQLIYLISSVPFLHQ